jgi:ferritin-like metal-binding protein YciE
MSDSESDKEHLIQHLQDMYALEYQAAKQIERAVQIGKRYEVADAYEEHLEQTREQQRQLEERLEARDCPVKAIEHLTMRSEPLGLRLLADIAPESPAKLAMHMYALGQLEVAAYELLKRIAEQAGDDETVELAEKILKEERDAAERVAKTFDHSAELMTADRS